VTLSGDATALPSGLDQTLQAAKQVAKDNPRMVANVVSSWTSAEK
jgi:flagellar M-ring protein FliF